MCIKKLLCAQAILSSAVKKSIKWKQNMHFRMQFLSFFCCCFFFSPSHSLTHCHSFRVCVYRVFSIAFVFVLCIDFTFTPRKLLVRNWMADRWWDFVDAPFVSEYIEGLLLEKVFSIIYYQEIILLTFILF